MVPKAGLRWGLMKTKGGGRENSHLAGNLKCVEFLSFCIKLVFWLVFFFLFEEHAFLQVSGLRGYLAG